MDDLHMTSSMKLESIRMHWHKLRTYQGQWQSGEMYVSRTHVSEQSHILRLIVGVSDGYVGFTQGLTLVSSNFTHQVDIFILRLGGARAVSSFFIGGILSRLSLLTF